MKWLTVLLLVAAIPATAQTTRSQAGAAGAAGVNGQLQAQGYKDIRNLHRTPDGQWVGKATRNGVERSVTVLPSGTTVAR